VQVIEVDVIDAETTQRRLAGLPDMAWAAIDPPLHARLRTDEPELRRQHGSIATSRESLADVLLRSAVGVGGVQQRDAELERAMDQRHRRRLVAHAAGVRVRDSDAHATEPDRRHPRTTIAQCSKLHAADSIEHLPKQGYSARMTGPPAASFVRLVTRASGPSEIRPETVSRPGR
jgi:hypothetical protein